MRIVPLPSAVAGDFDLPW